MPRRLLFREQTSLMAKNILGVMPTHRSVFRLNRRSSGCDCGSCILHRYRRSRMLGSVCSDCQAFCPLARVAFDRQCTIGHDQLLRSSRLQGHRLSISNAKFAGRSRCPPQEGRRSISEDADVAHDDSCTMKSHCTATFRT